MQFTRRLAASAAGRPLPQAVVIDDPNVAVTALSVGYPQYRQRTG
jgi:hypothetical protein